MFPFLASKEQGTSKRVVHPPSQALCAYNPRINVKRLKHENQQCQIEWKLQLKQKYLKNVIWNACCRLLLRKALKPLIWTGPSVFSSKPSGSFNKLQFNTKYVKISIWNTRCLFFFGGGGNSEAFNLSWPKSLFFQKSSNVWRIFSFNTESTVQTSKTFQCVQFQLVKVFLVKIQKCWGAPLETSDFLQIWADFDRICHKHAGLRPVCEDRASTRETCEQKNLKKQVVRKPCENPCEKKNWKSRSCENRAKTRETCENPCEKKTIVRTVRKFHPNSTLDKKIPNFAPKSAYSNFWPKIARACAKKPKHFNFWPKTTRVCLEICTLDFMTDSRPLFPETCTF